MQYEIQICTNEASQTWRTLGARHNLTAAKRTGAVHVRTFFNDALGQKITFDPSPESSNLYAFYGGGDISHPAGVRIRPFEIKEGGLVTLRLHATAEQPDCHKGADGAYCSHSHHQVGKVLCVRVADGIPVADVDWFEVSHRYAGSTQFPTGVRSTALEILKPVNPFLREYEVLEGVHNDLFERHCHWKIDGKPCGKPVVHIFWRWADKTPWDSNDPFGEKVVYHQDSWRHADGTPNHGQFSTDSDPISLCEQCGYEGERHCSKCHAQSGTLTVGQQAYGDLTTCSTEGCGYEHWYDIGD